jgi:hypothetical protein
VVVGLNDRKRRSEGRIARSLKAIQKAGSENVLDDMIHLSFFEVIRASIRIKIN